MSGGDLPSNPVVIDLRTLERAVQTGRHYGFQQDIWTRAANEIDRLQSENTTFRNAQKACADCDGPTMERVRQMEAELAEARLRTYAAQIMDMVRVPSEAGGLPNGCQHDRFKPNPTLRPAHPVFEEGKAPVYRYYCNKCQCTIDERMATTLPIDPAPPRGGDLPQRELDQDARHILYANQRELTRGGEQLAEECTQVRDILRQPPEPPRGGEPVCERCQDTGWLQSTDSRGNAFDEPCGHEDVGGQDFDKDLARVNAIRQTPQSSETRFLLGFIDNLWREYSRASRAAVEPVHRDVQAIIDASHAIDAAAVSRASPEPESPMRVLCDLVKYCADHDWGHIPVGVVIERAQDLVMAGRTKGDAKSDLGPALRETLNRCCAENKSNTPDYILAEYLLECLAAFDKAVKTRDIWYRVTPESACATSTIDAAMDGESRASETKLQTPREQQ